MLFTSKNILVAIATFHLFTSCGLFKKDDDDDNNSVVENSNGKYDVSLQKCPDRHSSSPQYMGECGIIKDTDLKNQDFRGKNLRGLHCSNSDLTGIDLANADLTGAEFNNCKLDKANLTDANCELCFFSYSSSLSGAQLSGANFIHIDAKGVNVWTSLQLNSIKGAKFNYLTKVNWSVAECLNEGMIYDSKSTSDPTFYVTPGNQLKLNTQKTYGYKNDAFASNEIPYVQDLFKNIDRYDFEISDKHFYNDFFGHLPGEKKSYQLKEYISDRVKIVSHDDNSVTSSKGIVKAVNYDSNWLVRAFNDFVDRKEIFRSKFLIVSIDFNGSKIDVDQPAKGIINLGPYMMDLKNSYIDKVATIAHEARHSDCLKVPPASELEKYFTNHDFVNKESYSCHHSHVNCPSGHALAGEPACDAHAWGAYSVSMVINNVFAEKCKNCTQREKMVALISEKDARTRIAPLEEMLSGSAQKPSMSRLTSY